MKSILQDAIQFAMQAHEGQSRKGTNIPYIVHPLETALLSAEMGGSETLVTAALLHDTLEDTNVSAEAIGTVFGKDVLDLVRGDSEDKSLSWEARKQATLEYLKSAGLAEQMLALADKLANLRSISVDYHRLGGALWQRFNRGYDQQKWYYTSIRDALAALNGLAAYQEYCLLVNCVFGC